MFRRVHGLHFLVPRMIFDMQGVVTNSSDETDTERFLSTQLGQWLLGNEPVWDLGAYDNRVSGSANQ